MRRVISFWMALLLALSLLPAAAWAEETEDLSTPQEEVQQEAVPQEEEQPAGDGTEQSQQPEEAFSPAPEALAAAPETVEAEGEEEGVTVEAANVDAALEAAGFTAAPKPDAAKKETAGAVWYTVQGMSEGLVTVSYEGSTADCRHMTLTVHKGTAQQWQALYRSGRQNGYYHSIRADIMFNAPADAVRGAWMCNDANSHTAALEDFLRDDLADYMEDYNFNAGGKGGYTCNGTGFGLAWIELENGKAVLSADAGEESYRYLTVWDNDRNDANGRLYRYNLVITIKVEEDIRYEWSEQSVMEALFSQGYAAPELDSQFQLELPEGLVQNVDYTLDYDPAKGALHVRLLPGDPDHWKLAYEKLCERHDSDPNSYPAYFYAGMGFPNPSGTGNKVLMYPNDNGYNLVNFVNGNAYWPAAYSAPAGYRAGWTPWIGYAWESADGDQHAAFDQGIVYSEYLVVAYADKDDQAISGMKFAIDVTIEVPQSFSYEWSSSVSELDQKLWSSAGFTAPEMGDLSENGDRFAFEMPAGLVEGTDYSCTYKDGVLTVTLFPGDMDHWRSAQLDSVIGSREDVVTFAVYYSGPEGAGTCYQAVLEPEDAQRLLGADYLDVLPATDISADSGYFVCGNGLPLAQTSVDDGGTNVIVGGGREECYYAVVWKNADGTYTKHAVKVIVRADGDFSHTFPTLSMGRLHTGDDRLGFEHFSGAWAPPLRKDGLVVLAPDTGKTWADIGGTGDIRVAAPDGYTLQSCFIDYAENGSQMVYGQEMSTAYSLPVSTFAVSTYTLRWRSGDNSKPDIVETLVIRVERQPLGKVSGGTGAVNIQDVQAIYEYLAEQRVPAAGESACDVNFDGTVDVYDLQRLYECVVLGNPLS